MKRLKENDYLYSSARIRVLERTLLNQDMIERMLESKNVSEAAKVLVECGYEDLPSITRKNLETLLSNERSRVYSLLSSFVPHREILDVFRIKYDYHNLKSIVKAESRNIDAERLLIGDGRYDGAALINAVRKADYSKLPTAMQQAIESAKDLLSRTHDPQLSDIVFDQACFSEMLSLANKLGSDFLKGYVRLLVDVTNIRIVVRSKRTKKEFDFLRRSLLEGGNFDREKLLAASSGGSLRSVFAGSALEHAATVADDMISSIENASEYEGASDRSGPDAGKSALSRLELELDDAVEKYLGSAKRVPFGEAPVIAFLAAKERDYTTIRAILSGLIAGVNPDAIRQRLSPAAVKA